MTFYEFVESVNKYYGIRTSIAGLVPEIQNYENNQKSSR